MYAVVDLETTGSHPSHDNIIEIAVYLHDGDSVTDQFCSLLNPGHPIPPFISKLTGITNEMVADAPTFSDIAQQLSEFIKGRIFVAHNVQFDHSFLKQSLLRHGHDLEGEMLCTIKAGRALIPGLASYKLSSLCKALDIQLNNAHRAYADALATAHVLTVLNDRAKGNLIPYHYQKDVRKNPSRIPEESLDALPSQAGLLFFKTENGDILLVSGSSNIRKKAWSLVKRFHHKRLLPLATEAASVSYKITGSEILASVLEIQHCKESKPKFNRSQKNHESRCIITDIVDEQGLLHIQIANPKIGQNHYRTFSSNTEARRILKEAQKKFNIINEFNAGTSKLQLDDLPTHNEKTEQALEWIASGKKTLIVHDKITQSGEHTLFWLEDEVVKGYKTLGVREALPSPEMLRELLTSLPDDPAIYRTIARQISRGKIRKITKVDPA
ncbi:MAG: exonuclease domain-containing protein [Bacteroidota bacterium]